MYLFLLFFYSFSFFIDIFRRQVVSGVIAAARLSLMQRFVAHSIGFDAITRQDYIASHATGFANQLNNPESHIFRVIACIDGTYFSTHKSSNFRALRQSFCVHKGRHLVKPVLIQGEK